MKAERWRQVERIYHSTLEKVPAERAAYLELACAGDDALRSEVESLLAYQDQSEDFIESPALDVAAKMMAKQQGAPAVVGQSIKHYKVISPLGAGGMGEVYLAEDKRLGRRVALKFLPAHLTEDKRYLLRFEQEARAIAALSHPHVCMIHEVVETDDGRACIVMEFVDGRTLRELATEKKISVAEALDVAIQVASALSAAHAAGIVHRDIKLENIMLRHDGYAKILDFGLAKLTDREQTSADPEAATKMFLKTSPGMVMGTVYYMSPEQARGLPVDSRTDIWSLGVVLYELIAGEKPFQGETPTDVIIAIAEREPVPLTKTSSGVPAELERIVNKALAKNRADRYQTADELLIDLRSLRLVLEIKHEVQLVTTTNPPAGVATSQTIPAFLTRNRIIGLAALLVLIAAAIFSLRLYRQRSSPLAQTEIKSLAVLPMENLSGDASQDYFADGMTETLITGLAKVGALRVITRTSVMQYKGTHKPLPDIARELNVDAIVEGSVQHIGDRVKITVQLIHAATERHLWTENYDRDLRDVLTLQNEVVRDVTKQIQVKLTPEEQLRLASERKIDPAAYDYFLRARYYMGRQTKEDNKTAIDMFDQAVKTDPSFALAHAALAEACVWRLFLFTPDEKDWEEKASIEIEKALNIDADLAEAHVARGRLLWTPGRHFPHEQAIAEYRRALSVNPNLDEAQNYLALVYNHIGAFDEALRELHSALAINPVNTQAQFRVAETLLFQGKYEEALVGLRGVPREVNPPLVDHETAWALFNLDKKEEAESVVDQFLKNNPKDYGGLFTSLQAVFAASAGQKRLSEEKIKTAVERGKGFGHFHHTAYYIACAYALMNQPEQAVKWLQVAADDGFPCYPLFERDPNLNNVRQDPGFANFLEKQKQKWLGYKSIL